MLLNDAQNELELSAESNDNNGIKERTGFRLERRVAAYSRNMGRGNGFGYHRRHLAVRRPVRHRVGHHEQLHRHRPFADHQPAVVAPGIAEALLATALGTVAAIPAVVIYNIFARVISGHRARGRRSGAGLAAAGPRSGSGRNGGSQALTARTPTAGGVSHGDALK